MFFKKFLKLSIKDARNSIKASVLNVRLAGISDFLVIVNLLMIFAENGTILPDNAPHAIKDMNLKKDGVLRLAELLSVPLILFVQIGMAVLALIALKEHSLAQKAYAFPSVTTAELGTNSMDIVSHVIEVMILKKVNAWNQRLI